MATRSSTKNSDLTPSTGLTVTLVAIAALFLAGCAGELQSDIDKIKAARSAYVSSNPDLDQDLKQAILAGELRRGMTTDQVIAAWGRPVEVIEHRTETYEEWVFGCDYPHYCVRTNRGAPFARGFVFDGVRHMSRAYFSAGRLSEWAR